MFTLPPLNEEDVQVIQEELSGLLGRTEAITAILVDKGGFVVATNGQSEQFDVTTLGALAAASYTANQAIANLINEPNFSSVYQQGESFSLLVNNIDEHCLLVVVFHAIQSVGAIKYYAASTIRHIAGQLIAARERAPGEGYDLSMLNMADPSEIFRRK
jgi:predicted regulator of Ras-like GTPase activity (Roadblock/LC7/MglB family)